MGREIGRTLNTVEDTEGWNGLRKAIRMVLNETIMREIIERNGRNLNTTKIKKN